MEKPEISVIVPIYNGEKYIELLISSLNEQSFKDFEVIFINDGSNDRSKDIIKRLIGETGFISIYSEQENRGVSSARNKGLSLANGNYITFLDVDDQVEPLYLEKLYNSICDDDLMISICKIGTKKCQYHSQYIESERIIKNNTDIMTEFLYGKMTFGVCGMMAHRKIFQENQLLFKEGYKYSEDLHMVWRILCHIKSIVIINETLYIYNKTPGSAMDRFDVNRFDSIRLMKDLESYIKRHQPEFYSSFERYAVARISWSVLWQAAHYLQYKDFVNFSEKYNFSSELKKLYEFPDVKVRVSAKIYCKSRRVYYYITKYYSRKHRR